MRTQHFLLFVMSIIYVTLIFGCSGTPKPSDLPELYPCTLMITQDGVPLADASVEFVPAESSQSKYRAVTQTDESGTSQMSTYGHSGVPAGKYKVVVTKKEDGEPDRYFKDESTGEQKPIGWKAYRLVEPKFSSAETTPHEIEIIGKKVTATFDVGKAIRVLIE